MADPKDKDHAEEEEEDDDEGEARLAHCNPRCPTHALVFETASVLTNCTPACVTEGVDEGKELLKKLYEGGVRGLSRLARLWAAGGGPNVAWIF